MSTRSIPSEQFTDVFIAELTEAAVEVAHRHLVKDSSIDVELAVWQALNQTLEARQRRAAAGARPGDRDTLAALTDAVYHTLLEHKPRGTFLDLELDLWTTFRTLARRAWFNTRSRVRI